MRRVQYMWFFVALVSGLAINRTMKSIATLTRARTVSLAFPAAMLWNVFLILLVIEVWVAAPFATTQSTSIETGLFLMFLLLPIGATLMANLVKPELSGSPKSGQEQMPNSLAEQFNAVRMLFFGVLMALPLLSILRELISAGLPSPDADLWFRLLIAVGASIGLFLRKPLHDTVLAVAMIGLLIIYTLVVYPYSAGPAS